MPPEGSGNSSLLDVTVPTDTKCPKQLTEEKMLEYLKVVAIIAIIIYAIFIAWLVQVIKEPSYGKNHETQRSYSDERVKDFPVSKNH